MLQVGEVRYLVRVKSGKIVQAGVQLDLCQQSFCVLGGCGFTRAEAINCFFGCEIRKLGLPFRNTRA